MADAVSRNGLLFMASREAIVLAAYPDGEHHSIGMGHNDPRLKPGDKIDVPEAFRIFRADVNARTSFVTKQLRKPLLQHELDALVSGYYQSGSDLLRDVLAEINSPEDEGQAGRIMRAFAKHDTNAAGMPKRGLAKRRAREACLFLTGEYGDLTKVLIWHGSPATTKPEPYSVTAEDLPNV